MSALAPAILGLGAALRRNRLDLERQSTEIRERSRRRLRRLCLPPRRPRPVVPATAAAAPRGCVPLRPCRLSGRWRWRRAALHSAAVALAFAFSFSFPVRARPQPLRLVWVAHMLLLLLLLEHLHRGPLLRGRHLASLLLLLEHLHLLHLLDPLLLLELWVEDLVVACVQLLSALRLRQRRWLLLLRRQRRRRRWPWRPARAQRQPRHRV